jgi:hypothetical protein
VERYYVSKLSVLNTIEQFVQGSPKYFPTFLIVCESTWVTPNNFQKPAVDVGNMQLSHDYEVGLPTLTGSLNPSL